MSYFYDDRGHIKEKLLSTSAREWAKSFISREARPSLSSAQLRRFYNDVKALESKVESEGFEKNFPLIKMMKSKVAYACPKRGKNKKVPFEFRNFLEEMIDNVNTAEDMKAFCLTFEAVVGYFYGEGGK